MGGGGVEDGGHAGGDATVTVGTASTVTPSAVEASAAEFSVEDARSAPRQRWWRLEAGTAMVAVMSTLPRL